MWLHPRTGLSWRRCDGMMRAYGMRLNAALLYLAVSSAGPPAAWPTRSAGGSRNLIGSWTSGWSQRKTAPAVRRFAKSPAKPTSGRTMRNPHGATLACPKPKLPKSWTGGRSGWRGRQLRQPRLASRGGVSQSRNCRDNRKRLRRCVSLPGAIRSPAGTAWCNPPSPDRRRHRGRSRGFTKEVIWTGAFPR